MRILHTSDWHVDKETRGEPRRKDHECVLDEIVDIAAEWRPHLVIHSGDVWDSPHPSSEGVKLVFETLHRLADLGSHLVIIGGNHDSPSHFRALRTVQGRRTDRFHIVDRVRAPEDGGVVEIPGGDGEVSRVACIPFIRPSQGPAIDRLGDWRDWHRQYAEGVALVAGMLGEALHAGYDSHRDILLLAAHLHVQGAVLAGSERRVHVDDMYATRMAPIPAVSYAAFGHIHIAQEITGGPPARYAGSPIEIDFGEVAQEKSVVLIEAHPGRPISPPELAPLSGGRRLIRLTGTVAEIESRADEVGDAIVEVSLHVDEPTTGVRDLVEKLLPRATIIGAMPVLPATADSRSGVSVLDSDEQGEESFLTLFAEYAKGKRPRGTTSAEMIATVAQLLDTPEDQEPELFPEEVALTQLTNVADEADSPADSQPGQLASTIVPDRTDAAQRARCRPRTHTGNTQ